MGQRSRRLKEETALVDTSEKPKALVLWCLAHVHPRIEEHDGDGFVIITAASDSGMVDIHDRRPLALSPEHAREWLDPDLIPERAAELARKCCQPTEELEWFPVSKDVGNVRNQGAALIRPI